MRLLLLLFITIPIVEMWVLIEVGARVGALPTIALVFLTALVGVALLRQQGLATLLRFNSRLEQGQLPAVEMFEGLFLALGGALLLTPGFVTDAIGFACLLPPLRRSLIRFLLQRGWLVMAGAGGRQPPAGGGTGGRFTIEGEYSRDDRRDR